MSTPIITNQWAGNFDCEGPCRRKRLMAEAFSKKALEKHRKQIRGLLNKPNIILRCKECVAEAERMEREAAAANQKKSPSAPKNGNGRTEEENRKCGACAKELPQSSFNRNQWSKGHGKSRCRSCVEQSVKMEAQQQSRSKEDQISAAKKKVEQAKQSGFASAILAAESELAALEAERVTGLKPVCMAAGGRGGGRGKKVPWRRGGSGGRGGRGIRGGGRSSGRRIR